MSTVSPTPPFHFPLRDLSAQGHIVFPSVSWEYYEQTLRELDGSHFRVTYDQGKMEIMSPNSRRHEGVKSTAGRLLELYAFECGINVVGLGSVTCRRADVQRGVEPDECYYVQNMPSDLTSMEFDLTVEPPPDLALEVDITAGSVRREPIYAALGVPEIWRFEGEGMTSLHRQSDGTYKEATRSLAFPDLPMAEFNRVLVSMLESPLEHLRLLREFQQWIRDHRGLG